MRPLGDHHGVAASDGGVPVLHELSVRGRLVVAGADPVVVAIGLDGVRGFAVTQLVECPAFPGLVLAAVLGQLDRDAAVDERAEGSAGLELG